MEKSERKSKRKHKYKPEELRPMASYVGDRPALLSQLFSALPKDKMLAMLPPVLRDVPHDELRADCLEMLLGLSARRIRSILRGEQLGSSSSSETDSLSEESREPSPNRQTPATSAPERPKENCSLLEIVELQLRARAIRAALSHGEADNGKEHPPPPKKCATPPVNKPDNTNTGSEIEAESALEPTARAKKRPVLVGPLKRLGKRVILTANNESPSSQSLTSTATPENKPETNEGIILKENSEKVEDETSLRGTEVTSRIDEQIKDTSVAGANAPETISVENVIEEFTTSTDLVRAPDYPEAVTDNQATPDEPVTEVQGATWVDRRLQQAASPTLRSILIGTTRQRLANNGTMADSSREANGNQSDTSLLALGPEQVNANEGSVTQYDSLASNALEIEPLVLNYEEE